MIGGSLHKYFLVVQHPELYHVNNGFTFFIFSTKYHLTVLFVQILRLFENLDPVRFNEGLETLHPCNDPFLIFLVVHHPLQKVVLVDALL